MSLFAMSDAFRAAASSRRSRLDFVDPTVLMRRTRYHLFQAQDGKDLLEDVRYLATRGCEEAVWLLSKLTSEGPVPVMEPKWEFDFQVVSREWLAEIVAREESPRAWYYRAHLSRPEWVSETKLLRRSAEAGFAPAMTSLASRLPGDESLSWLRKAAELRDPWSLSRLAEHDEPNRFALHLEAANLGDRDSMKWLANSPQSGLSLLQRAVWGSRAQFLGGTAYVRPELRDAIERMAAGDRFIDDLRLVHAVGRELEGIEQLCGRWSLEDDHLNCIDFYLLIVHSARRAALQTIVAVRELRMPRELAILIARRVYDSRDDAVAWCEGGQIARKQSRGGTITKRQK